MLFLKIVAELNFREEADSQTIEHQRRADRPNRLAARMVRRLNSPQISLLIEW